MYSPIRGEDAGLIDTYQPMKMTSYGSKILSPIQEEEDKSETLSFDFLQAATLLKA